MTNQLSDEAIADLGAGFQVDGFDQLWRAIGRLPFVSQDGPYAWRGVSDSSFSVQSTAYRAITDQGEVVTEQAIRQAEKLMLSRAREWGLGRVGTTLVSDLQLLAVLQHHGLPTRLLDVTANPLTALWFACASRPETDGLLLAFNLSGCASVRADIGEATWGTAGDPLGWHLQNALDKSSTGTAPFVFRPTFLDPRMAAQEGFFISSVCPPAPIPEYREVPRAQVDGMFIGESAYIPESAARHMLFDDDPEFVSYPQALWSFVITKEMKADILPALESNFNRRANILFPDIAGFREWARR